MVCCNLEQRVFLNDDYVKYGSSRKCREKFRRKFIDEGFPSRQTIHILANKLRTLGLLVGTKQKHKLRVVNDIWPTRSLDLNLSDFFFSRVCNFNKRTLLTTISSQVHHLDLPAIATMIICCQTRRNIHFEPCSSSNLTY
jgi:hypothetical protein